MDFHTLPAFLDHWADTRGDKIWLRDLREDRQRRLQLGRGARQVEAVAAALEARFGNGQQHGASCRATGRTGFSPISRSSARATSRSACSPRCRRARRSTSPSSPRQSVLFLGESPNWEAVRRSFPQGITDRDPARRGNRRRTPDLGAAARRGRGAGKQPQPTRSAADDMMSLVFTSGTTGLPKGVIQTHAATSCRSVASSGVRSARCEPRYFSYLPLSHIAERQIVEYSSLFSLRRGELQRVPRDPPARTCSAREPHMFFGPPRIWEQFQQAVIAKFGGQEALDAALGEDAAGIGKLVLETHGSQRGGVLPDRSGADAAAADSLVGVPWA
jgi:long-chain acyl-CoA synthetase